MSVEYKKKIHIHPNTLMPIVYTAVAAGSPINPDPLQPGYNLQIENVEDLIRSWSYRIWYAGLYEAAFFEIVTGTELGTIEAFGNFAVRFSSPSELSGMPNFEDEISSKNSIILEEIRLGAFDLPSPLIPKFSIVDFGIPVVLDIGSLLCSDRPTSILEKYKTCQDIRIYAFNPCTIYGIGTTPDWGAFVEDELVPFVNKVSGTFYISSTDPLGKLQHEAGKVWEGAVIELPFGWVGVPAEHLSMYLELQMMLSLPDLPEGTGEYNELYQGFLAESGVLFLDSYARYFDYTFEIPVLQPEGDFAVLAESSPYLKIFADYSFYNPVYEAAIKNLPASLELVLPSVYLIDAAAQGDMSYYNLLTLWDQISGYISGSEAFIALMENFLWSDTAAGSYMAQYASAIQTIIDDPTTLAALYGLLSAYNTLFFSPNNFDDYLRLISTGLSAPFFIDIEFRSKYDVGSNGFEFAPSLAQNLEHPATVLMEDISATTGEPKEFYEGETSIASTYHYAVPDSFATTTRNVWDIHEWFNWYCIPQPAPCEREAISQDDLRGPTLVQKVYFWEDAGTFPTSPAGGPVTTTHEGVVVDPYSDEPQYATDWLIDPITLQPPAPPELAPSGIGGWGITEDLDEILKANAGDNLSLSIDNAAGIGVIVGLFDPPDISADPCEPKDINYGFPTSPASPYGGMEFLLPPMIASQYGGDVDCSAEDVSTISQGLTSVYEKLDELVDANLRTYEEILSGVPAYSEPVFYRVEKTAVIEGTTKTVIQNMFFPVTEEADIIRYIDTQILPDKEYEYKIFGYQLVIGSQYWYEGQVFPQIQCPAPGPAAEVPFAGEEFEWTGTSVIDEETAAEIEQAIQEGQTQALIMPPADPSAFDPSTNDAYVRVCQRPHIVLVETEYTAKDADTTAMATENPPIYPEVEIVPYRGVNDKILINLNGSIGTYIDKPIIISPLDTQNFIQSATQQGVYDEGIDIEDTEITFQNDDYPAAFEIHRMSLPPQNYVDFYRMGRKTTLPCMANGKQLYTSNSFIDTLTPNTKYWYTFRCIDVHGNLSNPTPIYQIEMVDSGNSIFPIIDMYSLPEKTKRSLTMPVRRYLSINTSGIQKGFSDDVSSAQGFVDGGEVLGATAEESVWGNKKFKIRVTSKHSGKQIDINFKFKKNPADISKYDPGLIS